MGHQKKYNYIIKEKGNTIMNMINNDIYKLKTKVTVYYTSTYSSIIIFN